LRKALIISGVLHVIVLGAVLLNFSSCERKKKAAELVDVPVEFATPSNVSESKLGQQNAKPDDATLPKPPDKKKVQEGKAHETPKMNDKQAAKTVAAAPPPPDQHKSEAQAPETPPKPEPEKKPEVADIAPEKKPEPKPKPVKPKPKPVAKPVQTPAPPDKSRNFDPNRINALLNRDPNAGSVAPSQSEKLGRPPSSLQDQVSGAPQGTGQRLSASEVAAFKSQISRCWSPPVGGLSGDAIEIKLHFDMNRDGTIIGTPTVKNPQHSAFFAAAADAAIRAAMSCQPYTMFSQDKYDEWRDMDLKFDPSRM
jgi:outer membrane biosynthesis protein TonB